MSYETIRLEKSDVILIVTLNRPEKLNALSTQCLQELTNLFRDLREDIETKFVIFTGEGKAFSVGADLSQTRRSESDAVSKHAARFSQFQGHDFIRSLENLEQITVAAING